MDEITGDDLQDQLREKLDQIGQQRTEHYEEGLRLAAKARQVTARAIAAGLSPQEISQRTGYQPRTVEKWETRVDRAQRRGLLATLFARWRGQSGD